MQEGFRKIQEQFANELREATTTKELEQLHVRYLGKKGLIQDQMKFLKEIGPEERPLFGKTVNEVKQVIQSSLDEKTKELLEKEQNARLLSEKIDVTLPGRKTFVGAQHPINQTMEEVIDILKSLGFSVQLGPDIETEYYNFEVLNFEEDHPARDMQDTFYIAENILLRTHTTNVQGRIMQNTNPPFRIICPGKVFRNESISARSHVFFHQVDGLYIDEGVSLQDLIATMKLFIERLFGKNTRVRFRPSYFPFVEPGMEVDIGCPLCSSGCSMCKQTGWLEILGAGMVHPKVLKNVGIDAEKYTGYAWGMGVERIAIIKHGVADIRLFAQNDMRFLRQFSSV